MTDRKYYWLKLKKDFFKRHDIKIIEAMPNGKDYILFYLKMLLESIDHDGNLRFNDTIPYNESMLSVVTNTNIDIVRNAMKVFIELSMIEICEDSTIYMLEVNKMLGSETATAERVRKSREKKQLLLHCNTSVTKCNTEIEIEKELKKEKEIKEELIHPLQIFISKNLPSVSKLKDQLTVEQCEKLLKEFPESLIKEVLEAMENYKQLGSKYKSVNLTLRNWLKIRTEKSNGNKQTTTRKETTLTPDQIMQRDYIAKKKLERESENAKS